MGALITIDVHARDVVRFMVKSEICSVTDFEWTKQLRYYWEVRLCRAAWYFQELVARLHRLIALIELRDGSFAKRLTYVCSININTSVTTAAYMAAHRLCSTHS